MGIMMRSNDKFRDGQAQDNGVRVMVAMRSNLVNRDTETGY